MARIGAVALKNSVYVLPRSDGTQEDFQWVLREVEAAGGDATLLEAQLIDGLADAEVEALFRAARDAEYLVVADEARELEQRLSSDEASDEARRRADLDVQRLERRFDEIAAIDYFGASGRESVHGLLSALRARLTPPTNPPPAAEKSPRERYQTRTWVTRKGVHVDRIASAWLIRRFIDANPTFKFVQARGYVPEPGELRFDMFEAEFSHEGDLCTFEVLCSRFELEEPGLRALAELVHDIDIKDGKFARPETPGLAAQLDGLTLVHAEDEARIEKGSETFEQLLAHFAKKKD